MSARPQIEELVPYKHSVGLPLHSERQLRALRESIEMSGQYVATLIWLHEGVWYILDGGTTLRLCQQALAARAEDRDAEDTVEKANLPVLEPKFEIFTGTPEEAEAIFIARNFQRRSATQSQVAMYVALEGFMPTMGVGPQDGRYIAVREASHRFAVSKTMLYQAGRVLHGDPELAKQVLLGNYSVGYAESMIRSRCWASSTARTVDHLSQSDDGDCEDDDDEDEGVHAEQNGQPTRQPDDWEEEQDADQVLGGVLKSAPRLASISVDGDDEEGDEETVGAEKLELPVSPQGRLRARITANGVFDVEGTPVGGSQMAFINALAESDRLERFLRAELLLLEQLKLPSLTTGMRDDMKRGLRRKLDLLVGIRPAVVCPSCKGESAADAETDPKSNWRNERDPGVEYDTETEAGDCDICDSYGYLTATMREEKFQSA